MGIEFNVQKRPATKLQVTSQAQWGKQLQIIGRVLLLAWLAVAWPLAKLIYVVMHGNGPLEFDVKDAVSLIVPFVVVCVGIQLLLGMHRNGEYLEQQAEPLSPLFSDSVADLCKAHPEIDTYRVHVVALRPLTKGDYNAMRAFAEHQKTEAKKAKEDAKREAEATALKEAFEEIHQPRPISPGTYNMKTFVVTQGPEHLQRLRDHYAEGEQVTAPFAVQLARTEPERKESP